MTTEFKIGDCIRKVFNNQPVDEKIFKIVDLKEVKGGDWHDGFTISFVATIETETEEPETEEPEEYCIQYINYMCQINNVYGIKV
jgi:hypothetical protein